MVKKDIDYRSRNIALTGFFLNYLFYEYSYGIIEHGLPVVRKSNFVFYNNIFIDRRKISVESDGIEIEKKKKIGLIKKIIKNLKNNNIYFEIDIFNINYDSFLLLSDFNNLEKQFTSIIPLSKVKTFYRIVNQEGRSNLLNKFCINK